MSAWTVNKLDIDVLVQVALVGTSDSDGWVPLVSDPVHPAADRRDDGGGGPRR